MTRLHLPQNDPQEVTRQLYRQAIVLASPAEVGELAAFIARFRRFSVFNTALIRAQRRDARVLATAAQWSRLGHEVREGALPVIVLAPFGPVQFLFEESDTHGRPVTDAERSSLMAPGPAPRANWDRTVEGARSLGVVAAAGRQDASDPWRLYRHTDLGHALGDGRYIRWELPVDGALEPDTRYARLAHELGHIYCGHVGGHPGGAWRSRTDVPPVEREAEAELVCQLVLARAGRPLPELPALQSFMVAHRIDSLDLGAVINAVDLVESRDPSDRRSRRQQKPGDPLPGQMGMFA